MSFGNLILSEYVWRYNKFTLCVCDDNVLKSTELMVRSIIVLLYFYTMHVYLIFMDNVCMSSYVYAWVLWNHATICRLSF